MNYYIVWGIEAFAFVTQIIKTRSHVSTAGTVYSLPLN